ncbi:MAG: bifunctional folylpolyglutamate synthase/dihydrofolate synthase [Ignavibacteriales bacterium]|nr:MAG: bifunctional folylpolyglutamate synthase/dihydrofolate synthase [Ignavibacteriales bacterium]
MDLQSTLNRLYSLHTFGIKLGLENISRFLKFIGDPQKKIKTFHIAGSNGKGSTSSFIASILQESGFKTGLYTSPHFVKFNERIRINGIEIPDEYIAGFVNEFDKPISDFELTFFEVTTAMAFQYFADNKVDYAVIETGLGGRLDATNVLSPLACIITSISLEHTAILGNTVEQIAAEKGGIIKQHSKVFLGKLPEAASKVIAKICNNTNSEIFSIDDYTNEKESSLELYTEEIELDEWTMPLKGCYQKYNAALAALAVTKTLDSDDYSAVQRGIKNVILNTGLQGRYEFFSTKPDVIFDSAHNPEGVINFLNEFDSGRKKYSRTKLIFGVLEDKAVKEMLSLLSKSFDEILVTSINNERACSTDKLLSICNELSINAGVVTNPLGYIKSFIKEHKDNCLVVLGSMYLLGEVKTGLLNINS